MSTPKKTQNFGLPYAENAESGDMGECMRALVVPDDGGDCATVVIDRELKRRVLKPTRETVSIPFNAWTSLGDDADEYKCAAIITLTTTLKADSNYEVELINDNLALFAKYGFGIASITEQQATIYAVKQPDANVSLVFSISEE